METKVFLTFGWVDSHIEESEKEFDSIKRAQDWLKGQREEDFWHISLFAGELDDNCDYDVEVYGYHNILEYTKEPEPTPEDLIDGEAELRSLSGYNNGF